MRRRVVQIGAGGFGTCWQRGLLSLSDEFAVVGLVDPDAEALRQAAGVYGLGPDQTFRDDSGPWWELSPDLVIDSSPPWLHLGHASRAFEAGADVIVSKPLALDPEHAVQIVDRASVAGRSVWVAQQMRYFPCFLALRQFLAKGEIGDIKHVAIEMTLDGRGWPAGHAWRAELPEPLITEAAVHHVDLIRWVLDDEIDEVQLWTWNPSSSPFLGNASAAGLLTTGRKVPVSYFASFAPNGRSAVRFDSGWTITGSTGTVKVVNGGVYVLREGEAAREVLRKSASPVELDVLNEQLLRTILGDDARSLTGAENLVGLLPLLASTVRS